MGKTQAMQDFITKWKQIYTTMDCKQLQINLDKLERTKGKWSDYNPRNKRKVSLIKKIQADRLEAARLINPEGNFNQMKPILQQNIIDKGNSYGGYN